jgi:hypothetical protein
VFYWYCCFSLRERRAILLLLPFQSAFRRIFHATGRQSPSFCEANRKDKDEKAMAGSFLKQDVRDTQTVLRIKQDNPPAANSQKALAIQDEIATLRVQIGLALSPLVLLAVFRLLIDSTSSIIPILMIAASCGLTVWLIGKLEKKKEELKLYEALVPTDHYNTEFTTVMADNSLMRTTIHFELPTALAGLPYHVEQLNRITETLLLRFVVTKREPPTAAEIEDHLKIMLVQFQDERQIPILRLLVAANIHVTPEKSKGIHV